MLIESVVSAVVVAVGCGGGVRHLAVLAGWPVRGAGGRRWDLPALLPSPKALRCPPYTHPPTRLLTHHWG